MSFNPQKYIQPQEPFTDFVTVLNAEHMTNIENAIKIDEANLEDHEDRIADLEDKQDDYLQFDRSSGQTLTKDQKQFVRENIDTIGTQDYIDMAGATKTASGLNILTDDAIAAAVKVEANFSSEIPVSTITIHRTGKNLFNKDAESVLTYAWNSSGAQWADKRHAIRLDLPVGRYSVCAVPPVLTNSTLLTYINIVNKGEENEEDTLERVAILVRNLTVYPTVVFDITPGQYVLIFTNSTADNNNSLRSLRIQLERGEKTEMELSEFREQVININLPVSTTEGSIIIDEQGQGELIVNGSAQQFTSQPLVMAPGDNFIYGNVDNIAIEYHGLKFATDKKVDAYIQTIDKHENEINSLLNQFKINLAKDTIISPSKYINHTSGVITSLLNYNATGYIDIEGCAEIIYTRTVITGAAGTRVGIAFFSEQNDESYISGVSAISYGDYPSYVLDIATVPPEAKYVRLSFPANLDTNNIAVYNALHYNSLLEEKQSKSENKVNMLLHGENLIEYPYIYNECNISQSGARIQRNGTHLIVNGMPTVASVMARMGGELVTRTTMSEEYNTADVSFSLLPGHSARVYMKRISGQIEGSWNFRVFPVGSSYAEGDIVVMNDNIQYIDISNDLDSIQQYVLWARFTDNSVYTNAEFDLYIVDITERCRLSLPKLPSSDGTYALQVSIADGVPTYSWVSTS